MHSFVVRLMTATALCLAFAGCAPLKPASSSMFFGNCITPPGADPCDSDMDICRVFQDVIDEKYDAAATCRKACSRAYDTLYAQNYTFRNCGYMLIRGSDLCDQECLRQYPAQK